MKQKSSVPSWALLLLGVGLCLSLAGNLYLYTELNRQLPPLRGTYCTDASIGLGTYLIFDGEGLFCRYTQTEGVLDDGTCEDLGEGLYALRSKEGGGFCILQDREGVYLFSGEENSIAFFPKLKELGTAYLLADIPGEYPEWLKPPA